MHVEKFVVCMRTSIASVITRLHHGAHIKSPRAKVQSFIANMNARQECQGYVEKIFLSIKRNLDALEDEKLLRGFLESINKFYTSLFAQNSGRSFNFLAEFLKIERRCRFYQTSPRASLSWYISWY